MKACRLVTTVVMAGMILVATMSTVSGQKMIRKSFDAESAFLMPGLNALILEKDGKIIVEMMPPKEALPKDLKDIDLLEGDEILMFNGKRVKDVEQLRAMFEEVAVGDSLKFGLRRSDGTHMTSFPKPDAQQQGGHGNVMMMTQTIGGDEDEGGGGVVTKVQTFGADGEEMDAIPIMEVGLIIAETDGRLEVVGVMNQPEEISETDPQRGDVVVAINGTNVSTADGFRKIYQALDKGAEVSLTLGRAGKEFSFGFVRSGSQTGGPEVIIEKTETK